MVYLPSETQEIWDSLREEGWNVSLIFHRFLNPQAKDVKSEVKPILERADLRSFQKLLDRREELFSWLKDSPFCGIEWKQELSKNMAIGLGNPSPLENGLTLDRVYGLPYIPASALKGITQDYVLEYISPFNQLSPSQAKKDKKFIQVFGAQTPEKGEETPDFEAKRGTIIFLDALPLISENPFDLDITNPHYQKYYSSAGNTPPGDYLAPNPIQFLVVKKRTKFTFGLISLGDSQDLVSEVKDWVSGALNTLGVGGKTRVGFGLFKKPFDIEVHCSHSSSAVSGR
jgi:CRISPR-associated protein Cmr6